MPIVRTTLKGPDNPEGAYYTRSANIFSRDPRLSFKAKGAMAVLLAKPDSWKISRDNLAKEGPDGVKAARAVLAELTAAGYLTRTVVRKAGKFDYETTLYENPADNPAVTSLLTLLGVLVGTVTIRTDGPKGTNGERWTKKDQREPLVQKGPTVPGLTVGPKGTDIVIKERNNIKTTTKDNYKNKRLVKINFDLPPHDHRTLKGERVFWKGADGELHEAVCTRIMPRTLGLARIDTGEVLDVVRLDRVFYANGGPGLSPVGVAPDPRDAPPPPEAQALSDELKRMTGVKNIALKGPRINAAKKCHEAALYLHRKGRTVADLKAFERWFKTYYWRGKQGEALTLKILSNLWGTFEEYRAQAQPPPPAVPLQQIQEDDMREMTTQESIWLEVDSRLRGSLTSGAYTANFAQAQALDITQGDTGPVLTVGLPPAPLAWVENRLAHVVARAAAAVEPGLTIQFEELTAASPDPEPVPA